MRLPQLLQLLHQLLDLLVLFRHSIAEGLHLVHRLISNTVTVTVTMGLKLRSQYGYNDNENTVIIAVEPSSLFEVPLAKGDLAFCRAEGIHLVHRRLLLIVTSASRTTVTYRYICIEGLHPFHRLM